MAALTGPTVVQERVQEQLARLPGAMATRQDGAFLVSRGSRVTAVQVIGLQPEITLVLVYAVVATDVPLVDGACRFLAARDLDLPLVHFELVDGRHLLAVHALLGEFLSGPDLAAAIDAVSAAAEAFGPRIRSTFGGGDTADLAPPTDPTTAARVTRPVSMMPSGRTVAPARTSRTIAVAATVLVVTLVAGAVAWWGVGSGLAVALVLVPLLGAAVIGPSVRRSGRIT